MPTFANRKYPKKIIAAAVAVIAVSVWFFTRGEEDAVTNQPLLAKVEMGSIENTIASAGTLKPSEYVDVGAQVSGQLKKLYVEVGDEVEAGQLLAEIDARVQEAKVTASRASIGSQEAQLEARRSALILAQANADRQQRLNDAKATSQLEYDTAKNNLASALSSLEQLQKQIEQSKATLSSDETQLEFTKIFAPAAGTVVSIEMREGRTLNSVQQAPTILRIADLSTMTVEAEISEADISSVKKDMPVYFTTLGSGDRRWYASVRQVLPTPTVTSNVVLYTALFDIANADSALYSEMTAQVYFVTSSAENVITVPVGALKFGDAPGALAANGAAPAANEAGSVPAGGGAGGQGGFRPPEGFTPPAGFTPGAGGPPGGFRGQGGGRGGFGRAAGGNPNAPRPATVTVVKSDGTQEERQIMVGVTSRVAAEVLSGLTVGEQVVAGILEPESETQGANNQNNGGNFRGGGMPFMRF
ncbi:MAG: efflux RND transporter periplasmic adaptor subunit [Pseudomonadota bacterium]